ncbi:MAG: hypothetical protein ACRDPK_15395 [Carbonactinosporaceae bacterium]
MDHPGQPRPGRPPRTYRWIAPLALALLALDMAAALVLVGHRPTGRSSPEASETNARVHTRPERPTGPRAVEAAVTRLLERRADAVLTHDRTAFLATVDPAARDVRARQERRFGNLSALPFAAFTYQLDDLDRTLRAARPGEAGRASATGRVALRYRIRGYDRQAVEGVEHLRFVRRGDAWFVAGDAAGGGQRAAPGDTPSRQLWDFGKVSLVRGSRSIVLGLLPGPALRSYSDEADEAVPAISAVWGTAWPRRVVVVVPETEDQMSLLLGAEPDTYTQIAAVTTGERRYGPDEDAPSDRVTINPLAYGELRSLGRRVVMTHEIAHIATRYATKPWTPMWLTEGMADYLGYRNVDIPVSAGAVELIRDIRAGRMPRSLPGDGAFRTTQDDLAQAYEMSWLACHFMADRYGESRLVAFYRAVGRHPDPDRAVGAAFREVLGTTEREFIRLWQDYLRSVAA